MGWIKDIKNWAERRHYAVKFEKAQREREERRARCNHTYPQGHTAWVKTAITRPGGERRLEARCSICTKRWTGTDWKELR